MKKVYSVYPRQGGQRGAAKNGRVRLHSPVRLARLCLSISYFHSSACLSYSACRTPLFWHRFRLQPLVCSGGETRKNCRPALPTLPGHYPSNTSRYTLTTPPGTLPLPLQVHIDCTYRCYVHPILLLCTLFSLLCGFFAFCVIYSKCEHNNRFRQPPAPWMALFPSKNRRFLWEFAQQTPKLFCKLFCEAE